MALRGVYECCLGRDAEVFELSSITSDVGTPRQAPHAEYAPTFARHNAQHPSTRKHVVPNHHLRCVSRARACARSFPDWPPKATEGVRMAASSALGDGRASVDGRSGSDEFEEVGPMVLVLFVALTDIQHKMGPTEFLPKSHLRSFHERRDEASKGLGGNDPATGEAGGSYCAPLLKCGDAVLMDAACFHAGGPNTLRARTLFHLSFARRGYRPKGLASFAQSLDADKLSGMLRLDESASWL